MPSNTTPDNIQIRPTQLEDLEPLASIYAAAYDAIDLGEKWSQESAGQYMHFLYKRNADLALTATVGNEIVGAFFADIKPWWDGRHVYDSEIFVRPDYQHKGVGKKLMKAMLAKALRDFDAVDYESMTYTVAGSPLPWYESLGFRVPEKLVLFGGSIENALKNLDNN